MRVKMVSWNLAGRVAKAPQQMLAVRERKPDVLALQEVTPGNWRVLRQFLDSDGWKYVETVCDIPPPPQRAPRGPRRYGLVIASRVAPRQAHITERGPWPERILAAELDLSPCLLRVITAHVPPGSTNGQVKVQVLTAVAKELREHRHVASVFVGDLNAPQEELPGPSPGSPPRIVTWAESRDGDKVTLATFRGSSGATWDRAERILTQASVGELGFRDVYRALHPNLPDPHGFSWCERTQSGSVKRPF